MNGVSMANCIRPETRFDCIWPAMLGMNDLSPCLVLKVSNVLFCRAILKVCVDSSTIDGLLRLSCIIDEGVICESPIVSVILKFLDS